MSKVLVDTSVWSLALRKKEKTEENQKIIRHLSKLIINLNAVLIGPIRQEILSGISEKAKFFELKERLSVFKDFRLTTLDYERAAEFYNKCRSHGIQGSHIDYLLCSVAVNNNMTIFTLDNDFLLYEKYTGIILENNF